MKLFIYITFYLICTFTAGAKHGWYDQESGTTKFLYGVCFTDSLYGWAVGDDGLIIHTTNGGEDWAEQESFAGSWLNSIYFVDRLNGWAVGDIGRIRHTTDGGETWQYQQTVTFPKTLNSVFFINKSKGWAVGPQGVISTTNGGETWKLGDSTNFTATKSIFFINENIGWACGANGSIIKTTDAGKNWINQNSGNPGTVYDILFIDQSTGWAVCRHEPKLLRTTDGGLNWLPQLKPVNGFFKSIKFIDKNIGWAAGQDGIIKSSDGGKNWEVQIPASRYNLWWIDFVDKNKGWAVGGNGTVLRTDNGGIKFDVDFEASITSGLAPLSTTFTDLSEGEHTDWLWDFGDGGTHTTKNPVYIYQEPGKYTVQLTISDGLDSDSKTKVNYITVTSEDDLIADFIADTTSGNNPLTVQFTDLTSGNPDSWLWNFGDGGTHKAQNPLHVYQQSGTFTVKLISKRNGTESEKIKNGYIIVDDPVSVSDNSNNNLFIFSEISPNPANETSKIIYHLSANSYISLKTHDLFGQEINTIFSGFQTAGSHIELWGSNDFYGNNISNGLYFVTLKVCTSKGCFVETKKIIYLNNGIK